jgi:5'-nucleotidase / UDP-sugar diphosphatase
MEGGGCTAKLILSDTEEDAMLVTRRNFVTRALMVPGLAVILAVFGLFLAVAPPAAAQSVQITLLHVSDTHSHLAAWGPKDANLDGTLGGLPKAAAIVAMERASDPDALFVHAGDVMDGDFFFNEYLGVDEFSLLKTIGLDAFVPGNHEFRFGPYLLADVLQAAWLDPGNGVPFLGTNLQMPADPPDFPLSAWVTPWFIKDVKGVMVGLFGLTTPEATPGDPAPVVVRDDVCPITQAAVNDLRSNGAQVVVGLYHAGMAAARELPGCASGIDVIVNGHDNALLKQPETVARLGGGVTLIVSAGNEYRWVGRLRLAVEGEEVSLVDYALLGADTDTPSLPAVQEAIDNLKEGIVERYGDVYHQPLAWADQEITLNWDPRHAKRDTALGNLFTDAYRDWTGTDIALEAFAYFGDSLPAGTIVGADVFRAMSYGNLAVVDDDGEEKQIARPWRLVTFRSTGYDLRLLLEKLLYYGGEFFPQVSGMRFDYDSSAPYKQKILLDTVHVNGHKLVLDRLYSVTVTEGIYSALKYLLGLPMQNIQKLPDLAFDAARTLVAARGELGLGTSNRIRDVAAIPGRKR